MALPDEPTGSRPVPIRRAPSQAKAIQASASDAPVLCERCRAAMFRMHAVWRCPSCGFKTDCCGW